MNEADVRRIVREEIKEMCEQVAAEADGDISWNSNTVQITALEVVDKHMRIYARKLEKILMGGEPGGDRIIDHVRRTLATRPGMTARQVARQVQVDRPDASDETVARLVRKVRTGK